MSEADGSLRDMNAGSDVVGWAAAEFVLASPALSGLLTLALARSIRSVRSLPTDTFLQAVVYPYTGAATGAVLGVGVSGIITRAPYAVFLLGAGIVVQLYLGGQIARWLRNDQGQRSGEFGPGCWQRDLEHLKGMYRISREDCLLFRRRADLIAAHGGQLRVEARRSRFRAYWRSRPRRVRVTGYAWIAVGVYVAVRQAWLAHSMWYLASTVTGGAWLAAAFIVWWLERNTKTRDGSELVEGASQICQQLELLPHQPSVSEWLGLRTPCCARHSPTTGRLALR
jgi:hypothetical protein